MKLSKRQQELFDTLEGEGATMYLGRGPRLGDYVCFTTKPGGGPVPCRANTAHALIDRGLLEITKRTENGAHYRLKRNR